MAESHKTWAEIQNEIVDNGAQLVTAQNIRDALYTLAGFGGLALSAGATGIALNSSTFVPIVPWTAADPNVSGVTADTATGRLTAAKAGLYEISYSLCLSTDNATPNITLGALVNTTDDEAALGTERTMKLSSNTVIGCGAGSAILEMVAGDYVRLGALASAGTPEITPVDGSLYLRRVR